MPLSARARLLTPLLAAALLGPGVALTAETSPAALKAAYTLNFAKFTHWPRPLGEDLQLCVAGRSEVGSALEDSTFGRVAGRALRLTYVRLPGEVGHCNLLWVSEIDPGRAPRLLAALAELPILTVSDIEGFARDGGMIELVLLARKLRFVIDLEAVRAAKLRLDPKLLDLALEVHGAPEDAR